MFASSCRGYTNHQRCSGNKTIVGAKYRGAQPSGSMSAMVEISLVDLF
jgi:hypothetical protein